MLETQGVTSELLQNLGPLANREGALSRLLALESARREKEYVKYWQPVPNQAAALKKFTDQTKVFGVIGGNRSGKTELGAFIATAWLLGKEAFRGEPAWEIVKDLPIPTPPNNIWVVGLDFPTLKNVIWREKLVAGFSHPSFVPVSQKSLIRKVNETEFQIFAENGSVLTGKSADSGREKFQSASCDLVWFDEECEKDVFEEALQRTRDRSGRVLLTLTPLRDLDSGVREAWVYDLYEQFKAGDPEIHFEQISVMDNPYIPEIEKQRLLKFWAGHEEERARLYGDFIARSGLVYPLWKPGTHVIPDKSEEESQRSDYSLVVIDPAATGTTAALWVRADGRGNLTLVQEYYRAGLTISEHAKNILALNGGRPVDQWLIDPKMGSQRQAENHKTIADIYRENHIPVRYANVDDDYGLGISREYVAATCDSSSRHPWVKCFASLKNFQWEIAHYVIDRFSKGPQKGLSKDKPVKRHDHLMNCFQYACAYRPRAKNRPVMSPEELKAQVALNSYT